MTVCSAASTLKLCMPVRLCFDGAQHERALSATSFSVCSELVEPCPEQGRKGETTTTQLTVSTRIRQ